MKNIFICLLSALLAGFLFHAAAADAPELKYGLYIHYGMDTFRHAGEKGRLPVERFAPASVNATAWAQAAKEAGMTFAVLTAKHETGFCLWDSKDYDYDIAHSPFKGDIPENQLAALMELKHLIANPPPAGSSHETTGGKPPLAERLKQVKTLYEQGLINKEDYDRKVKEIIDSL
jgi:hypothetical protein